MKRLLVGFEILLDDRNLCNLTEVNMFGFVNEDGSFDKNGLIKAQKYSARMGYRMATIELELNKWNEVNKKYMLTGCSLTGMMDFENATKITRDDRNDLLSELKVIAVDSAKELAKEFGTNESLLNTAIKPSGCCAIEHTRVLEQGILTIDEMFDFDDKVDGFHTLHTPYSVRGNNVGKVFKNNMQDIFEFTLKNGRKLKVSQQHLMSVNGDWKKAIDLEVGDKIDYEIGTYRKESHSKLNYIHDESIRKDAILRKTPSEMSEDLAWLIGAYYANGCFTTNYRIKFMCNKIEVHNKVKKLWKELFDIDCDTYKCNDRECYYTDFRNRRVFEWFNYNGLNKHDNMNNNVIPLKIRTSSWKDILSFIIGCADNDGCFHNKTFSIDSAKEAWLRHIQEVGESIGLVFGFSVNNARSNSFSKKPMYKLSLWRTELTEDIMDYVNANSVKAQDNSILMSFKKNGHPYEVKEINVLKDQRTYDIEVENEHWYYQGALKSHNTISQVAGVSSGVHYSHAPYYIRRVRISAHDPLAKAMVESGFNWNPEVGQSVENHNIKVFEFPVKAPEGKTKYNVSAIEQLELYLDVMEHYVQHNASNTIHVRPHEWDEVEQFVYDNWDKVVGISFLSLDDSFYQLLPYEEISKEQYEQMIKETPKLNLSLLSKYETFEDYEILDSDCEGGICPIR